MKRILLIVITSLPFLLGCGFNCTEYLNNEIRKNKFEGIVIGKSKTETGCFGKIFLLNKSRIDTLEVCYCVVGKEKVWDYIELNDSISKPKESIIINVYRNNNKKEFSYPCCNM